MNIKEIKEAIEHLKQENYERGYSTRDSINTINALEKKLDRKIIRLSL